MHVMDQLVRLVRAGNRFRKTPIVDDDFTEMRDLFDQELLAATNFIYQTRPHVVCLCGSTRFKDAFVKANLEETLRGHIVLSVGCYTHADKELGITPDVKVKLDELHKRKIDLCDSILVVSDESGYIGLSTTSEISYAVTNGKTIRWLNTKSQELYNALAKGEEKKS